MTGHLEEEKMQVYVRLGIRLLYKGAKSRMEGARGMFSSGVVWSHILIACTARGLLKSMSVKQGVKFDSPDSAKEILPFIAFHGLNVSEMLEDPSSFSQCSMIHHCSTRIFI
jgi:phosphatidylserine decarboxylase